MNCDICGKRTDLVPAIVDSTKLSVCKECSNFGTIITEEKTPERPKLKPRLPEEKILEVITSDFADKVKKAREKLNLKQRELAQKIAEKESVIHRIESNHAEPSIELAKKLERFFNIKLIEEHKEERKNIRLDFKNNSLTIGDLLKLKKE